MEPFTLSALVSERQARREREAETERFRRRRARTKTADPGTVKRCPETAQPASRPTSA